MDIDAPDSFDTQTNAFTSWLQRANLVTLNPKIAIHDLRSRNAGRGVIATSALDKDELIFLIPRTSVLNSSTSVLGILLAQELQELDSSWLSLILVLVYETRPDSPWKPYIDLLPTRFDTLMYWSPEELAWLKGSAVVEKIGRHEADQVFLEKLWPVVERRPEVFAGYRKEGFLEVAHRMASAIMAYSFDLEPTAREDQEEDQEDEDKVFTKAMVPMADMLNADADRNNCRLFQLPDVLEMRTIAPVAAGEELFNDYGPLPRSDLLRRYGYVTDQYAPFDVVEISAPAIMAACGPEKKNRIEYLVEEDVLDDAYDIDASLEVPEEILVVVQMLLMSGEDFEGYRKKGKVPKPRITKEVGEVVVRMLDARLKEYETSVQEDQRLLGDPALQGRRRWAVEVRLGEKRILEGVIDSVKRQMEGKRGRQDADRGSSKKVKSR